jgi:hypothetical protein
MQNTEPDYLKRELKLKWTMIKMMLQVPRRYW